jgi:hypothetical protein
MIEGFKNYFNKKKEKNLIRTLSQDELDDQFLKLKEIYGCNLVWSIEDVNILIVKISFPDVNGDFVHKCHNKDSELKKKIFEELKQIKIRMESMFSVEIIIEEGDFSTPSGLFRSVKGGRWNPYVDYTVTIKKSK